MSTELTTLLNPQAWDTMKNQAMILVKSGFLPKAVDAPEKAIAIMMKGHEVGFPPMQSFAMINIIQGKPCVGAEGQLALIFKNCVGAKIDFIKLDVDCCIIEASRPNSKPIKFKFDLEDAKAAQLLGKDNWKKFPRNMYRSRCVSEMARSMFPDAIMGFSHTPEELDPNATIDEEGQVVELPPPVKLTSVNSRPVVAEEKPKATPLPDRAPKPTMPTPMPQTVFSEPAKPKLFSLQCKEDLDAFAGYCERNKVAEDKRDTAALAMEGKAITASNLKYAIDNAISVPF